MNEEYAGELITVTDDDGNEYELEILGDLEFEGRDFTVFVPSNIDEMDPKDPDYGLIFLERHEENGEEIFESVDDEAFLDRLYEYYESVTDDEEAAEEETENS